MGAASVMEALYAYVEDGIYDKESFDEDEDQGNMITRITSLRLRGCVQMCKMLLCSVQRTCCFVSRSEHFTNAYLAL
jgi:hypothetical protein